MKDPKDKNEPAELVDEIRKGRKFSLAEAVGRQAGGNLKGASPIPSAQQLLLQIEAVLDTHLPDSEGSLTRTILAQFSDNPPLLAQHFDDANGALIEFLNSILDTPANLAELVRQADARWGRDYDERPHFEKSGQAPDAADPYTRNGVRILLSALRHNLTR